MHKEILLSFWKGQRFSSSSVRHSRPFLKNELRVKIVTFKVFIKDSTILTMYKIQTQKQSIISKCDTWTEKLVCGKICITDESPQMYPNHPSHIEENVSQVSWKE